MAIEVGRNFRSRLSALLHAAAPAPDAEAGESEDVRPEALEGLAWKDVQQLIARLSPRGGFSVAPTADSVTPVDFVLHRGEERVFVQCRHWKVWEVPDKAVRELA